MSALKEQLYRQCCDYISKKEAEIKKLIAEAQESSANETKSSAGDKYETTREVLQQEIDLNLSRLNELNKLKTELEYISPTQSGLTVSPGSVVYTSNGNFYISISAGKIEADGTSFYAISPASPIASKMLGQKAGYAFDMNGKRFEIKAVT
jgi:transcription elongation GreA/GreB family factor